MVMLLLLLLLLLLEYGARFLVMGSAMLYFNTQFVFIFFFVLSTSDI